MWSCAVVLNKPVHDLSVAESPQRTATDLDELLATLAEAPDLASSAAFLLSRLGELLGSSRGFVRLLDPSLESLNVVAMVGFDDGSIPALSVSDLSHPVRRRRCHSIRFSLMPARRKTRASVPTVGCLRCRGATTAPVRRSFPARVRPTLVSPCLDRCPTSDAVGRVVRADPGGRCGTRGQRRAGRGRGAGAHCDGRGPDPGSNGDGDGRAPGGGAGREGA